MVMVSTSPGRPLQKACAVEMNFSITAKGMGAALAEVKQKMSIRAPSRVLFCSRLWIFSYRLLAEHRLRSNRS
jgi:hypothetical protein